MSQIFMVPGTYDENLAYVETGDVASRNYAAGEFLTWKGVLHSAKMAISTGETFVEGTNVQDESDGGALRKLTLKDITGITFLNNYTNSEIRPIEIRKIGRIVFLTGAIAQPSNVSLGNDVDIATLPSEAIPDEEISTIQNSTGNLPYRCSISPTTGNINIGRCKRSASDSSTVFSYVAGSVFNVDCSYIAAN